MSQQEVSLRDARRIALQAQGFGRSRPKSAIRPRHIRDVIRKLGLVQLDFVNVLVPAHYLVAYSRLGPYDQAHFHETVYGRRDFTEQWAHEASIVPSEHWPLLEHRRRNFAPYPNSPIMKLKGKSKYLAQIYELIRQNGSVISQDLPPLPAPKRNAGDWHRSVPRWALEYHFGFGKLAVADRLANYQRVYDLPERVLDPRHLECNKSPEECERELLKVAADACGIATARDLADYYRMNTRQVLPRLAELVENGDIMPARVEGWQDEAYLSRRARRPRALPCSTLLSPFDPVVWYRPRAERLFDFFYRIEIYVPAAKRKWGYYVLPFLMHDRIVARVDLKADRKQSCLLVPATHAEENIDEAQAAPKLAEELWTLARWLNLGTIKVSRRGKFARLLADEVKIRS